MSTEKLREMLRSINEETEAVVVLKNSPHLPARYFIDENQMSTKAWNALIEAIKSRPDITLAKSDAKFLLKQWLGNDQENLNVLMDKLENELKEERK